MKAHVRGYGPIPEKHQGKRNLRRPFDPVDYHWAQLICWFASNFIVKPDQLDRERPYIAWNIASTRRAWDLDRVTRQEFSAETTPDAADPANNRATLKNIRLCDWRPLQDTLRQIQEIRTYYDFPDIDIDRYTINGELREVMLAARELNVDKLPESSRNCGRFAALGRDVRGASAVEAGEADPQPDSRALVRKQPCLL